MDINQLKQTYNIELDEIVNALKKHNITIQLSQLNDIPENWIPLIEDYLKANTAINIKDKEPSTGLNNHNKIHRKSKSLPSPTVSSKKIFYAYVKYVGPENDHAFIVKLSNINNIASQDLYENDYNDYKLTDDCASINKGQIILCSVKSKKYKIAKIHASVFHGTLRQSDSNYFTDWISFTAPKIIKNIKLQGFDEKKVIVCAELYWNGYGIIYKKSNEDINTDAILPKVDHLFQRYLVQPEIKENEITTIYKSLFSTDVYEMVLRQRFNAELKGKSLFSNNKKITGFLKKWELLAPSLVTYSNIGMKKYFDLFFQMWLNETVNIDFWKEHIIDACVQYQLSLAESKNNEEKSTLSYVLTQDHLSKIESALPNYFNQEFTIDTLRTRDIFHHVVYLSSISNKEEYYKKINDSLTDELKFQRWVKGETEVFPKSLALVNFAKLNVEKQAKVIEGFNETEIVEVLDDVKPIVNNSHFDKLFKVSKLKLLEILELVSFDIEGNIDSIYELAWNTNDQWYHYNTPAQVSEGFEDFKKAAENPENILIGHNIIDFDCPILEKKGVKFNQEQLWDTFRVEALLSPDLEHYALVTKHDAKSDAQLTIDLFVNQLLRILILSEAQKRNVNNYLPERIVDILEGLKNDLAFSWVKEEFLIDHRQDFYRPQAKIHRHVKEAIEFVSKSDAPLKLIIGPQAFKKEVLKFESIQVINSNDELDFKLIDKKPIEGNDQLDKWLKSVLLNFIIYCDSNRIKPYWGNLPITVKVQLEKHKVDVFPLMESGNESSLRTDGRLYVTADELYSNRKILQSANNIDTVIIQPKLITVTQKGLLKEIKISDYRNSIKDNNFWLKFSGGQSYVSLTKTECESFDIKVSESYTNFWMEKYQVGKYRIWANNNWEDVLQTLPISNKNELFLEAKKFPKAQTVFVRANFSTTKKVQNLRFNPESIYRSRYWVFQKELVKQIVSFQKLNVLLIQHSSEIEILEDYFRAMGFYIPSREASRARRLELLYESEKSAKLIIERIDNISKVVNANYLGELNVIIDSFNLAENFYVAQNSSLLKAHDKKTLVAKQDRNEELGDEIESEGKGRDTLVSKKPLVKDSYLLLSLHLPQINYYRSLLTTSNPNHKLWILDSRIDDFPELNKLWNAATITFSLQGESEQYEKELKLADQHIPSVRPTEDIPFNTEEIKEILKNVFLDGGNWFDYQEPYLDLIIPGETDELITLPTGGGKSLLFQAPALFKSAFTNKLTIVVTPLKALMEDQVAALWEKGFYGSVEYLNSDRGSDVQMIYKAMAGGELALLFVTPERFRSRSFLNALNVRIQSDGGLEYFVFDEAHCVSQWGHEFRPDYFNCAKKINYLKKSSLNKTPLLLFSATVSKKIFEDFKRIFT